MALGDEEFLEVFSCSKEEFNDMPSWKQVERKKEKGLY